MLMSRMRCPRIMMVSPSITDARPVMRVSSDRTGLVISNARQSTRFRSGHWQMRQSKIDPRIVLNDGLEVGQVFGSPICINGMKLFGRQRPQ